MSGCIKYRKGYKYQLCETFALETGIIPPAPIVTDWFSLSATGLLTVLKGYAWDGPSGPTIDRKENMRGSLPHDVFYEMMRLGLLDEDTYRPQADALLKRLWLEDGMQHWLANLEVKLVNDLAEFAAKKGSEQPILYAPAAC